VYSNKPLLIQSLVNFFHQNKFNHQSKSPPLSVGEDSEANFPLTTT